MPGQVCPSKQRGCGLPAREAKHSCLGPLYLLSAALSPWVTADGAEQGRKLPPRLYEPWELRKAAAL